MRSITPPVGAIQVSGSIYRVDGKLFHCLGGILPDGPWHAEPDRVEFESDGFTCLLLRNSSWCGYVAVPPGHPWHGKGYDDVRGVDDNGAATWPDVHGGLTYAEKCSGHICHVAKPGEPDDVWWVGFDCNHSGDLSIYDLAKHPSGVRQWPGQHFDRYRDVDYVQRETAKLAQQAKRVAAVDSMHRGG